MKKLFMIFSAVLIIASLTSCGGTGSSAAFKVIGSPTVVAAEVGVSTEPVIHYGSPTFEQITFYTVWLSTSAGCTDLVQVADYGADGQQFDMFANPTLFAGDPPAGIYNCMVIKLLDTMNFKPAESGGGVCIAGSTYAYDIARGDDTAVWVDQNFHPITINDSPNIVYFFATTDPSAAEANHVSPNQDTLLTAPLVSPGQVTLAIDFTDMVYIQNVGGINKCWLDKPQMAFK
jgi:hypothetical protein